MRVSVIVTTYNATRELDFVFCGLSRQTRMPEQVLVADDGSSQETSDLITEWAKALDTEVRHVWQSDRGYRKARIVNEAVRRATGNHLIFLDGDTIAHSRWVYDHVYSANGKRVLCGRRVKLGQRFSRELTRERILSGELESLTGPLLNSFLYEDTKRFLLGIRLPTWLACCFHPRPRKLMGLNYSLPKDAFERVNGYDEDWTFYGHEDRDLELRLLRCGIPFYPLLNRAVTYHVYHTMRSISEATRTLIKAQEASNRTRCERGVCESEPFDPLR